MSIRFSATSGGGMHEREVGQLQPKVHQAVSREADPPSGVPEKNLSAFQWDGIVTDEAVRSVWNAISILEPELKTAKVDFARTYDNKFTSARS
jgi:hypothetical protein